MPKRDVIDTQGERQWRARPVLALLLRGALVLVPALVAVLVGRFVYLLVGTPATNADRVLVIMAVLVASAVTLMVVERFVRRAMPLVVLLRLSLLFPDRAPSRFRVARRAATLRELEERVSEAHAHGVDDDPTRAAATILSLMAGLAAHDGHTRGHSERVRVYTDMIAEEFGLTNGDRERLRWAAMLHDIGKLEVPSSVLNKPSRLDADDWETIRRHPIEGARIAAPLLPWLGRWGDAIVQHHERWDGEGYPYGLTGAKISLAARIVTVADAYETMTASRSYCAPKTRTAAREELARCAGSQFDPAVVRAFLAISLGRLRWAAGPLAWLGQLPVVRDVFAAGAQLSQNVATSTASVGAVTITATATLSAASLVAVGASADASGDALAARAVPRPPAAVAGAEGTGPDVSTATRSPRLEVARMGDRHAVQPPSGSDEESPADAGVVAVDVPEPTGERQRPPARQDDDSGEGPAVPSVILRDERRADDRADDTTAGAPPGPGTVTLAEDCDHPGAMRRLDVAITTVEALEPPSGQPTEPGLRGAEVAGVGTC